MQRSLTSSFFYFSMDRPPSDSNSCINWNQYYTECQPLHENPFSGAISFDNIGLAWVAIFLVRFSSKKKTRTFKNIFYILGYKFRRLDRCYVLCTRCPFILELALFCATDRGKFPYFIIDFLTASFGSRGPRNILEVNVFQPYI